MTDETIIRLICKAMALTMERIQQGFYNPPTVEELKDSGQWSVVGGQKVKVHLKPDTRNLTPETKEEDHG